MVELLIKNKGVRHAYYIPSFFILIYSLSVICGLVIIRSAIVKSNWKIIFTTRNNYLEDLQGVLLDTFRVPFYPINLDEITNEQLLLISKEKDFLLPDNEKVLDLIKKPFYLNEYLKCYKAEEIFNLKQFKEALWNNVIVKRDINRGKAFLELSNNRALTGQFYIVETNFKNSVKDLIKDGIIGNESKGYFPVIFFRNSSGKSDSKKSVPFFTTIMVLLS